MPRYRITNDFIELKVQTNHCERLVFRDIHSREEVYTNILELGFNLVNKVEVASMTVKQKGCLMREINDLVISQLINQETFIKSVKNFIRNVNYDNLRGYSLIKEYNIVSKIQERKY